MGSWRPPRGGQAGQKSESEQFWYERLCRAIEEKKLSTEPRDYQDPDDPDATINMETRFRPQVYPVETSQRDLRDLPDATLLEPQIVSLSESLDTRAELSQYSDQTIVDEQLILSQLQETDNISLQDESDEELLDLLDDLAHEAQENEEEVEEEEEEKAASKITPRPTAANF